MNRVKKFLSISLLIFISCGFHTEPGPLHPIPILKVKMGEVKTIDLSKYLKEEKIPIFFGDREEYFCKIKEYCNAAVRVGS